MKKLLPIVLTCLSLNTFAQKGAADPTQAIIAEGKALYQSEMASWQGTAVFLEQYKNKANIGGYFSYVENGTAKCVFFSKKDNPKVIGTVSFDKDYSSKTAKSNLAERDFTPMERELFLMRQSAFNEVKTNRDNFFSFYQNTSPTIIPIIKGAEKKVYILTGSQTNGVVIFGNDYLLTYSKDNKIVSKKQIHKNMVALEYFKAGEKATATTHSHTAETGDYITATDICTLMLNEQLAKWDTHNVVSKNYLNVWNCKTDQLMVVPMTTVDRMLKDQQSKK